ncbi:MAG: hypothetical protein R2701_01200 [Acidimicrobiales bacterium]
MTTPIERAVKLLAGGGVLPAWLRPVVAKATGFQQIVTRGRPAASVLDLPGIDVPYLRASQALGLGAFPLALDGDAHRVARDLIGGVLAASSDAHLVGVAAAADRAEVVLSTCGSRLEVIGGLIDPCLQSWVEAWFGLPGFGPELHHVSRAITTAIFFNPALQSKRPDEDLERAVVAEVRATNDRLLPRSSAHPMGPSRRSCSRPRATPRSPPATCSG